MSSDKKPNIVFILSDDQGAWSLGSYGNREIISPNLDCLAEEGMRFETFYCTSPVCSPARASILTGKMPSQHGILDWLGGGSVKKRDFEGIRINLKKSVPYLMKAPENVMNIADDEQIGFEETVSYQRYMSFEKEEIQYLKDHICYTEVLQKSGYECGLAGKWHLGDSAHPQKGFEFWEVIARGGTNYMLPEYIRHGRIKLEHEYVTDLITEDALSFIEEKSKKDVPFYLSVHYTAPHDPWEKQDQPEDIWNLYNECPFDSIPDEERHPWQAAFRTCPRNDEERKYYAQGYYTCITAMDKNIGRILELLKEKNLIDNTIIIFSSDNGFNLGHHGIWGKGNGTFPLNMYESSVKVPFIIYGKGQVLQGKLCRTLVSQYDIFPTLLELAGCSAAEIQDYMEQLPGRSFAGLLDGSKNAIRDEVVIYDEYGPVRMIRDERYKLVYRTPYGPHELYDLENDPQELSNLIDIPEYRNRKIEMYGRLKDWFERYTDERYDGTLYPVDGEGQMNRLEKYGTDSVVFRSF